jgi:hypothetical protein
MNNENSEVREQLSDKDNKEISDTTSPSRMMVRGSKGRDLV